VLVLGLTFKENCPDLRNTRVVDVVTELQEYGCSVDVYDPLADAQEARREYGLNLICTPNTGAYDGVVLAVAHDTFRVAGPGALRRYGRDRGVFCDLKSVFARDDSDLRL
jgi:UDP-N-acetyl-D-galactosamine dehydrogenase